MIGYLIQQELGNVLPFEKHLATLLTQIEVDPDDPAFGNPTKPIGPVYTAAEADALAAEKGWAFKPDGDSMRRVVPSPLPKRIFGAGDDRGAAASTARVVICAGGGGIPVMYTDEPVPAGRRLVGIEAVIDKDLASALLAADLKADALAIVTDVDGVYAGWGTPRAAEDRPGHAGGAGRRGVRRGLDGAEGEGRLPVRRADRRAGRDRLDHRDAGDAARRGRDDGHERWSESDAGTLTSQRGTVAAAARSHQSVSDCPPRSP